MDTKTTGINIAKLRKKSGMTQLELAGRLNVSNKTISKWESGQGFPEVTQFPMLAEIFGVSIDYLMCGENKGIAIAGNILVDNVKRIDCYPQVGMLANVSSVSRAVGGCVSNTVIDIAKMDRSIPLYAIGRVGSDENGRFLVSQLQKHGIDVENISISSTAPTSFSDVMSQPSGERTFFHARGANAEFHPLQVNLSAINCKMLHIGYILLLDAFDAYDSEYGTVMARFLHDVQSRGIKTSVDVVSDSTADYAAKICPSLKYCDYAIMNEIECCQIWNLPSRKEDGTLNIESVKESMLRMADCGVSDKVIIHSKEAGLCLDVKTGQFTLAPSLSIPTEEIKGNVGAGDAFCAGCLYGIYNELSDKEILEFASSAAACNLFAENSIDGMRSKDEIMTLSKKYERRIL